MNGDNSQISRPYDKLWIKKNAPMGNVQPVEFEWLWAYIRIHKISTNNVQMKMKWNDQFSAILYWAQLTAFRAFQEK